MATKNPRQNVGPSGLLAEMLAAGFARLSDDGTAILRPDGTSHSELLAGWRVISGAGAPTDYIAAIAASLLLASAGANNDLTLTAVAAGVIGNDYSVSIVQAPATAPLSVTVVAKVITITLPADGANAPIAKTATQVKAAWDATPEALALFTIAKEGSGAGNVAAHVAALTANGAEAVLGTGGGDAGLASLYVKTDAAVTFYFNAGSAAQAAWKAITTAA